MVVGDPEGMRHLADRFAKDASQLRHASDRVGDAWAKADGSGPWFDDIGFMLKADAKVFRSAGERLDALALTIRKAASTVEHEMEAERQRAARAAQAEEARHIAAAKAARENG
ncbi:MAG: hypothetical protein JWP11_1049 [Frankiales bacterium]|nr:hypothetical protein [Frankiales bacterium]